MSETIPSNKDSAVKQIASNTHLDGNFKTALAQFAATLPEDRAEHLAAVVDRDTASPASYNKGSQIAREVEFDMRMHNIKTVPVGLIGDKATTEKLMGALARADGDSQRSREDGPGILDTVASAYDVLKAQIVGTPAEKSAKKQDAKDSGVGASEMSALEAMDAITKAIRANASAAMDSASVTSAAHVPAADAAHGSERKR